jgi:glycosyltransferase involved in cell wall biosynthesis
MHILIIPGEELNENNTLSSVFEIHQAQALKDLKVNVGFISTYLRGSIHKEFIRRVRKLDFRLNKKFQIKVQQINDINLVVACGIYLTPSFLNLYQKERIHAGVRAFQYYNKKFGQPDIIHAHSRFLESILIAKRIKELFGIPYIITEHSTFHQRNIVSKKEYIEYIEAVEQSESWIVVSNSLGEIIMSNIDKFNLKLTKSFRIVPNVVDPKFEFIENKKKKENFVFLNVATLDDKKNHFLLLESFKIVTEEFKNIELRIGGQGILEKKLKIYAKKIGLNNVKFLGSLDRNQVKDEFINSDAFVLSSNVETFGVVIIESLAIGRPVIATICGGPEYIINKSNGILVKSNNTQELSDAMRSMIECFSSYNLEEISADCIHKYGPKAIGKTLVEIYLKALN